MPTLIVDKIELKKQSGTLVAAMLIGLDLYGNVLQVPIDITKAQYNDLFEAIALKANNDNVVHLHGQETIDGSKIFVNDSVDQNYHSIKILRSKHGKAIQIINNSDAIYEAVSLVNNKGYGFVIDNSAVYGQIINNIGKIGMQISNIGEIGLAINNGGTGVGVRLHSDDLSRGDLQQTLRNTIVIGSIDYLGNIMAPSFKTKSGLSTQFLKADGSIDSTLYAKNSDLQNLLAGIDPAALASLNDLIIAYRNANGDLLVAVDLIGTNLSNVIDVEIRNRIAADLLLAPIKDPIFTGNGITIPRLTTAQILAIVNPVQGTLVFNTDTNLVECFGVNNWNNSVFNSFQKSISSSSYFQNQTLDETTIEGMVITVPTNGIYKVDFNGQYNTALANITQQAAIDLNALYLNLNAQAVTDIVFPAFTSGTTIVPGVYETVGAYTMLGSVTLDGLNNPNSIFIFKTVGPTSSGAGAVLNLVNGATANNVFFLSGGAVTLGAGSNISGTFISPLQVITIGAGTFLNGRALSMAGAVSTGGNVKVPVLLSQFEMGITSTFAMFTIVGAVSNVGPNIIIGDVGTNFGVITGFEAATLSGNIYLPAQGASNCKFSIYIDGVIVPTSTRERTNTVMKDDVILNDTVSISAGQSISIKVLNSIGISRFFNRNLTVLKIN